MTPLANELFLDYYDCYKNGWTYDQLSSHPLSKGRNIYFHVTSPKNVDHILNEGLIKGGKNGVHLAKYLPTALTYASNFLTIVRSLTAKCVLPSGSSSQSTFPFSKNQSTQDN